jgi:hypothetical protein
VSTSCQLLLLLLLQVQREDHDAFGVAKCAKAMMQENLGS